MQGPDLRPEVGLVDECRERIYSFLAALFSHPDEGIWGRVLNAGAQRLAIATADALRTRASRAEYPVLEDELPADQLDLRFLVLELCQPLEHLKAEFERVFCVEGAPSSCSPHELDHLDEGAGEYQRAERLADLALLYRSFGFSVEDQLPVRPDHIRFELEFARWLLAQRRLASRLTCIDREAAMQVARCDLAQRNFFGDHLSRWVPSFAAGLRKYTGGGYFEPLGRFLAAWIPLERHVLCLAQQYDENENNCRGEEVSVGI
jgi:TorA maturation chaperone TorD